MRPSRRVHRHHWAAEQDRPRSGGTIGDFGASRAGGTWCIDAPPIATTTAFRSTRPPGVVQNKLSLSAPVATASVRRKSEVPPLHNFCCRQGPDVRAGSPSPPNLELALRHAAAWATLGLRGGAR